MAKKFCENCGKEIKGESKTYKDKVYDNECFNKVYKEDFEQEIDQQFPNTNQKLLGIIEYLDKVNTSIEKLQIQMSSMAQNIGCITGILIIIFLLILSFLLRSCSFY